MRRCQLFEQEVSVSTKDGVSWQTCSHAYVTSFYYVPVMHYYVLTKRYCDDLIMISNKCFEVGRVKLHLTSDQSQCSKFLSADADLATQEWN